MINKHYQFQFLFRFSFEMSLFSIPLRPAKPRHHQTTPFIPTYILFDFIIAKDFPLSNRARWGEVRVGWWWWWWLTRGSARIYLNWNVSPFSFTALASPAFAPNRQPNLYLWLLDFYLLFSIFFQYICLLWAFLQKIYGVLYQLRLYIVKNIIIPSGWAPLTRLRFINISNYHILI